MNTTSRKPERESGFTSTGYASTVWISRNPEQVMRIKITGSTISFQKMALSEPVASSISNPPGTSLLWVARKIGTGSNAHEKGLHLKRRNEHSPLKLSMQTTLGAGSKNCSALGSRVMCQSEHVTREENQPPCEDFRRLEINCKINRQHVRLSMRI